MIAQLLHNFPPEHKTEAGTLFWSGPKRLPAPITFDANDETHLNFIFAASNLFAYTFGLPEIKDRKFVADVASKLNPKKFEPKKGKISVTN